LLRKQFEKKGKIFNHVISNRFNTLIFDFKLIEISLSDQQYTWTKSVSNDTFALLDRFFLHFHVNINILIVYLNCIVTSLSRISSDHNPLILHTLSIQHSSTLHIRFEKEWLSQDDFLNLLHKWWNSFVLIGDLTTG
jgi:hypothetical protein